uniref:Uncharacterized protein TCIL3000_1_530 n=1 Tax=Trypanosoma congolense (strain IL3000) TaxID=1068625 RepID=G0UIU5_TRYCI|nr:unnamed protein product [Trypanosoma congolense IL3000]
MLCPSTSNKKKFVGDPLPRRAQPFLQPTVAKVEAVAPWEDVSSWSGGSTSSCTSSASLRVVCRTGSTSEHAVNAESIAARMDCIRRNNTNHSRGGAYRALRETTSLPASDTSHATSFLWREGSGDHANAARPALQVDCMDNTEMSQLLELTNGEDILL